MKRILPIALSLCCLVFSASPVFADAFTWTEVGSAGDLPGTANITIGGGALQQIFGTLSVLTEVDLFRIMITDFSNFSATTEDSFDLVSDPQLFLFNAAGQAVYMNDDGIGLGSQSQLPAGDPLGPQGTGIYYLGIGWYDNEPFSALGRMFTDGTGTNGPDVGGLSTVTSWNSDVSGRPDLPTGYSIHLTGAAYSVPAPATVLLLATGLVGLFVRRRQLSR